MIKWLFNSKCGSLKFVREIYERVNYKNLYQGVHTSVAVSWQTKFIQNSLVVCIDSLKKKLLFLNMQSIKCTTNYPNFAWSGSTEI